MKRRMSEQWRRDRRGMTLVELMIALVIFGIVIGVVFSFLSGTRTSYTETRQRVQYQQSVRAVLSLLTREIRSAGCDPALAGFDPFAVADVSQVRCQADLNGDADVVDADPDESVTYTFNAGTGELTRTTALGAFILLRDLQNWTFTYFDGDGNVLAAVPLNALDRARVREVMIDIAGETAQGEAVQYATRISLRNG
jgi:prepilin-type N-terminal cleavage/methylation domain-containing protein